MDEGLEDDVEETRLAKVQETATTFARNRYSVFEGRSVLFILNPRMIGLTTLLYDYHGSEALRRNGRVAHTLEFGLSFFCPQNCRGKEPFKRCIQDEVVAL